ncbi:MAG TPA: hypothetical protein VMY35_14580 [Phycisphaerae bacterium]|nr:hypothetical protein [Phycisphaerae bacterium]
MGHPPEDCANRLQRCTQLCYLAGCAHYFGSTRLRLHRFLAAHRFPQTGYDALSHAENVDGAASNVLQTFRGVV